MKIILYRFDISTQISFNDESTDSLNTTHQYFTGIQNDKAILIHYGSYGYIHSPNNIIQNIKAELRGIIPKRLNNTAYTTPCAIEKLNVNITKAFRELMFFINF